MILISRMMMWYCLVGKIEEQLPKNSVGRLSKNDKRPTRLPLNCRKAVGWWQNFQRESSYLLIKVNEIVWVSVFVNKPELALQRLPLTRALEGFFLFVETWPEFSWTSISCFHGSLTAFDREGSLVVACDHALSLYPCNLCSLFVSPCPPESYLLTQTKIEPVSMYCKYHYPLASGLFRDNLQHWLGYFARMLKVQFYK